LDLKYSVREIALVRSAGRVGSRAKVNHLRMLGMVSLLVICGTPAVADSNCTIDQIASLPADYKNGDARIDVSISGQTVKFVVGTGQAFSQAGGALVRRLGLARANGEARIASATGTLERDLVVATDFHVGNMAPQSETLVEADGWGDGTGGAPAGLLGQDFFRNYDIELDPTQSVVNIFLPIACTGRAAYWWDDHFEIPLSVEPHRAPFVEVVIDGKTLEATIQTEEAHSSIDIAEAKRQLGVPSDIEAPMPTSPGVAAPRNPSYAFKELVFGPITLRNPKLELKRYRTVALSSGTHIKDTMATTAPVVIGMDILGKFHSMISYRNDKIYFTLPNERKPMSAAGPK
jgi:hypothetical protein